MAFFGSATTVSQRGRTRQVNNSVTGPISSGDEESERLFGAAYDKSTVGTAASNEPPADGRPGPGYISFTTRRLACIVLGIFLCSQVLLIATYQQGRALRNESEGEPILTRWILPEERTKRAKVRMRGTLDSKTIAFINPGTIVEAHSYPGDRDLFLLRPVTGFANKKLFRRVEGETIAASPLFYVGYRQKGRNITARYTYAPDALVVAQQCWNAVQVLHLFLALCIYYQHVYLNCKFDNSTRLAVGAVLFIMHGALLPLSIYVTSPGAMLFSSLVLVTTCVGLRSRTKLVIDVGSEMELRDTALHRADSTSSWFVIKEEVLGFCCNCSSWLYNFNAERYSWPYLINRFFDVDKLMGWVGGNRSRSMDVFREKIYTLGIRNIRVPIYVPRAVGSSFGSHLFAVLWSFIPFIYVSYYGCMFVLAKRSPGVLIQRLLLSFAIFHFLFMTDVVTYKYGRGFWSPTAEAFHWSERISWRIAVLMPIYQNSTNGHFICHAKPGFAKVVHYVIAIYGLLFLFLQVGCSDFFRLFMFVYGSNEPLTCYQTFDLPSVGVKGFHPFSYHGALLLATIVYPFLLLSGFRPFHVSLSCERSKRPAEDDDAESVSLVKLR